MKKPFPFIIAISFLLAADGVCYLMFGDNTNAYVTACIVIGVLAAILEGCLEEV
jgi:hypothetical protein